MMPNNELSHIYTVETPPQIWRTKNPSEIVRDLAALGFTGIKIERVDHPESKPDVRMVERWTTVYACPTRECGYTTRSLRGLKVHMTAEARREGRMVKVTP